jgi:hypothetical protein
MGSSTATAVIAALTLGTLSSVPAGATTRLRSGTLHAQLAGHISSATGTGAHAGPLVLAGANVMAIVVGVLAVAAFIYMVVTLIRRRFIPA